MCYSGICDFEDHMGECRLRFNNFDERQQWAKDNKFIYCGTELDEEDYINRSEWLDKNPDKFKEFKEKFIY